MYFSTITIAFLATMLGTQVLAFPSENNRLVTRNKHKVLFCADDHNGLVKNDKATEAACLAYKAATDQEHPCPDCEISSDEVDFPKKTRALCRSASEKLGGKEFEGFCIANGSKRGECQDLTCGPAFNGAL